MKYCENVQISISDGSIENIAAFEEHLNRCPECQAYYNLQQKIEQEFEQTELNVPPAQIKNNLMNAFKASQKPRQSVLSYLGNIFQPQYRTAVAFAFSILFMVIILKPILFTEIKSSSKSISLFEVQDSLVMHNFHFAQKQNLGITSNHDSLLSRFLQVFPE